MLQAVAALLAIIIAGLFLKVPALTVTDPEQTIVVAARPGDVFEISFFHSLYHVRQTEYWTIEDQDTLRLNNIYFGCYAAVLYYNADAVPGLVRLSNDGSGDGEFMLYYEDYTARQVVLHVSPTSRFELALGGRTYPLYSMVRGGTVIKWQDLSFWEWLWLKSRASMTSWIVRE